MKALATILILCLALTSFAQRPIEKEPGDEIVPIEYAVGTGIALGASIGAMTPDSEHLLITKQEAKDAVRAMEIALRSPPYDRNLIERLVAKNKFNGRIPSSAEAESAVSEELELDRAWARAVLEAWKEKIKEGVK